MANINRLGKRVQFAIFAIKYLYESQSSFRRFAIKSGLGVLIVVALIKLGKKLKKLVKYFAGGRHRHPSIKHRSNKDKGQVVVKNPSLNRQFFIELAYLLKLMFPRWLSKQTLLLGLHTLTLVCRTFLSIYVARLEGLLVRNIVEINFRLFWVRLIQWLLIAVPATTCNSLIRYLESKLDLELKSQLIKKAHKYYFDNRVYYKIALKQTDSTQIDQNMTEDVDKLVHLFVHLYSQITKPMLDIVLITHTLISMAKSKNFHYALPTSIGFAVMILTGALMRRLSPKFGKMAADIAKQKGYLRFLYSRIQTNSEEIAFYSGEKIEAELIDRNYVMLKKQLDHVYFHKFWYIIVEQFLLKYVWSAAGLCIISLPVLMTDKQIVTKEDLGDETIQKGQIGYEVSQRTEEFTTAKNLLNAAADAAERIMTSYKEIIELTGFTRRVFEMFRLFESVNASENAANGSPVLAIDSNNNKSSDQSQQAFTKMDKQMLPNGIVFESSEIDFISVDSISIISPNGDILVPSLTFKIESGMNTLITGPNGCGKSSLFRILSGLWPLYNGIIKRPLIHDLYYVPQRPYLAIGSLRDQIIYPDNVQDMMKKSISDKDLSVIMEIVNLQQVVVREGGFDAVADWKDVLSGGEKQRLGLSRLFYHRPKFAFLDECTSAVSVDVEGKIYQTAIHEYKITLLTIAHRSTLWCHHNYLIQFDGIGNWKFEELNQNLDARLNLKQEKDKLEKQLLGSTNSKNRLKELCELLGESSIALDS